MGGDLGEGIPCPNSVSNSKPIPPRRDNHSTGNWSPLISAVMSLEAGLSWLLLDHVLSTQVEAHTANTQVLLHILVHSQDTSSSFSFLLVPQTTSSAQTILRTDCWRLPVTHPWGGGAPREPHVIPTILLHWQHGLQTLTFHTVSECLLGSWSYVAPGFGCQEKVPPSGYSAGRRAEVTRLLKPVGSGNYRRPAN